MADEAFVTSATGSKIETRNNGKEEEEQVRKECDDLKWLIMKNKS